MNKCWAHYLGNCSDKITGEHIISNSILKEMVLVEGFHWCRDSAKSIGSSNLTSKILCKYHNEQLSPSDSEIKKLLDSHKDFQKTSNKIGKYSFSLKKIPYVYNINGNLLEKWFVKTLINICIVNQKDVKIEFEKILPILFGNAHFEKPYGLNFAVKTGQEIIIKESIQVIPLLNDEDEHVELAGGLFILHGFYYIILLPCSKPPISDNKLQLNLSSPKIIEKDWGNLLLNWHNNAIQEFMKKGRKEHQTQVIKFLW